MLFRQGQHQMNKKALRTKEKRILRLVESFEFDIGLAEVIGVNIIVVTYEWFK